jgi:dTDP-4-dehydrorhamnose 3,5-epimerase
MNFTPLSIDGVWVHEPEILPDERGSFHEVFKLSLIKSQIGRDFEVRQVNQSVSGKGVLRGIHWTDNFSGQAKYISCAKGSLWDVVVDLRPDSKTFGQWDSFYLSEADCRSILISEGIGHAFLALEEGTVANYLCTAEFDPLSDKTINPLDTKLDIPFEAKALEFGISKLVLSAKDKAGTAFQPK